MPAIKPQILFEDESSGYRRVAFDVPAGRTPLRATDVMLTAGGEPIWQYDFLEYTSRPLAALFLIFDCRSSVPTNLLRESFLGCLQDKNPDDLWSVVRLTEPGDPEGEKAYAARPPYKGPELKNVISRFDELPLCKRDELAAIIRLLGSHGLGRHLVLLLSRVGLGAAEIENITQLVPSLGVAVDVIAPAGSQEIPCRDLIRETGGIFITAPESGISPAWLAQVYAGMTHRYEVTYSLEEAGAGPFEVLIKPRLPA